MGDRFLVLDRAWGGFGELVAVRGMLKLAVGDGSLLGFFTFQKFHPIREDISQK